MVGMPGMQALIVGPEFAWACLEKQKQKIVFVCLLVNGDG